MSKTIRSPTTVTANFRILKINKCPKPADVRVMFPNFKALKINKYPKSQKGAFS